MLARLRRPCCASSLLTSGLTERPGSGDSPGIVAPHESAARICVRMRCLDIPTDDRLRKTLHCQDQRDGLGGERSDHLRILEEFDQAILLETGTAREPALPITEIDFCLELARPERVGGIVVVLQHPDPSQIYNDGYAAEEARGEMQNISHGQRACSFWLWWHNGYGCCDDT